MGSERARMSRNYIVRILEERHWKIEGIGTDPPATWDSGFPPVTWTTPELPFVGVLFTTYWSSTEYAANPLGAWNEDAG